jgi:hypothetical protein
LQPLKPFLGLVVQIQLCNFEQFICIHISHFSNHGEPLGPIIDVLMGLPLKQFIHPLGASHFANVQFQTKVATFFVSQLSLDHLQVTTILSSFSTYSTPIEFEKNQCY